MPNNDIENLLPITPICQKFETETDLIDYANQNPLKVIAHNLFCIAEYLNMLNNILAVKFSPPEPPKKHPVNEDAIWIYDKK